MNRVFLWAIGALLLTGMSLSAEPRKLKVATVKMAKLLNEYHLTKDAEAEEKVERERIKKNDAVRLTAIKALAEELKKMESEFNDPSLAKSKREQVAKVAAKKDQELRGLQDERKQFLERRGKALRNKMMIYMKDIREQVRKSVNTYSKKNGFDFVFDDSALTSSQVPFLLYSKNPTDVTEAVLKELNKYAPKQEVEKSK